VKHFLREFIYEVLHNNSLRYSNLISLTSKEKLQTQGAEDFVPDNFAQNDQ